MTSYTVTVDDNSYVVEISTGISSLALDGLSDVLLTSPADNDLLTYNAATSQWTNQTAAQAGLIASTLKSSGSGAPSTTPTNVLDTYLNTATGQVYIATGVSSSSNWYEVPLNFDH